MSRAAGERKLSIGNFCNELGLSFKKLLQHDEKQFAIAAEILGLNSTTLAEVRTWSVQPQPGVHARFRNETYVSRALINPVIRGCPSCLRGNVTSELMPPQGQMAMQGHWQLRYVEVCVQHRQPLEPLWKIAAPLARNDYASQLQRLANELMSNVQVQSDQNLTDYDRWLDKRLSTGVDETQLSSFDIDTAATFCNLLGAEVIRTNPEVATSGAPSRAIGFDIARRGPREVTQALKELALDASGPQDGMRRAFGHLHRWLAHDAAQDPRCDPYRDLLREVILDTFEMPASAVILGKEIKKRRLHSVFSASAEMGRSPAVTRRYLEHAGIISKDDTRPHKRLTFEAESAAPALSRGKRLVMAKEMAKRLGTSTEQFETLAGQGVFVPVCPLSISKFQWDVEDVEKLFASLTIGATSLMVEDENWQPLGAAARRARIDVSEAIDAIRNRKLEVRVLEGERSYSAIRVRQDDMNELCPGRPAHPTLSEFGEMVGLQKNGMMNALFEGGHISAERLLNPATRRFGLYMNKEDQAKFHARFTTLKLLSLGTGLESRELVERIRSAGVRQFRQGGMEFGKVYLLQDIQRIELDIDALDRA
ncbi:TniQ family protein [Octadecabacter sp. CECT 8868]|nr:TniQ family protein [Octadecabacter algicola]